MIAYIEAKNRVAFGLSHVHQAITLTNTESLLIGPLK